MKIATYVRGILLALFAVLLVGCGSAEAPQQNAGGVPVAESSEGSEIASVAEPESLEIAKIGAKSSLVPLGLNPDETVQVPPVDQPMQAGWYRNGPPPGQRGPSVILGHVDGNKKPGIFFRLKELARGDTVDVKRKDGSTARFVVEKVEQIAKTTFPTDAVYGDTERPELRLITCGGNFDHGARSYKDNVIVYAALQT